MRRSTVACRAKTMMGLDGEPTSSAYVRFPPSPSRAYAMGMPAHQSKWNTDMVRSLPDDGKRYELIDGVLLVSPSPAKRHQRAVRILLFALQSYCEQHDLGEALDSPADIELSPTDIVQPDVFVVSEISSSWDDARTLRLAVEVLSPTSVHTDRSVKRPRYQRERVPEFWIVDLDARVFERWRPDDDQPDVVADVMTWQPLPDIPALSIPLDDFFRKAVG
jgi:Uma2 family endonuclease